ncbi:solute carrier family 23 member 2-like [Mizuhopecten yessoensis]|uniref:Solute carrier family 23 member 2 n=1 Tax=Mizuhopecten yessoensis TaxID=6573 RepID=A0A210PZY4_MIZYE|nr:solute carrier family 23 member 2-like [Mizuhopecten yessoensis]OWF42063.1 Solute carrier family 23 member 2 [Mizuhopecten yessoensis]
MGEFEMDELSATRNQGNTAEVITTPENGLLPEVEKITVEYEDMPKRLLFNVSDRTPFHMAIFCAFQQVLIVLSGSLAVSSFVADAACADEFPDIKADLLSSAMFMSGLTTLLMVLIGFRLPVFQGSCADYVIPLMAIRSLNKDLCHIPDSQIIAHNNLTISNGSYIPINETMNIVDLKRELAFSKLQEFQGCLILVGVIHCLVGLTGTVGFLLRFVGPITIVPTILLTGIFLSRATAKFSKAHWGISSVTAGTAILLSLYLGNKKMPCPAWSKARGFYWYWYPFHQVFSILIGILVGWGMSAIMTVTGALTNDPDNSQYMARIDARSGIITTATWFKMPYPNRFGPPTFNAGIFIAFLIATVTSILDSIGDYYACARVCNVPPPPRHAVNRGIAVEGFGSILSGLFGCGHATTTSGGNIGALGVTGVASRDVFWWVSLIYIVFGLVGKVSAVFITIPVPVLGGAMIIMFGMLNGIILSNLQVVSLSSTRNLAIIGTALLVGLMVPYWLEAFPDDLNTGSPYYDNILKSLLVNPNLCGGILACFLDNTVPGTLDERGITAWRNPSKGDNLFQYSEGLEVYNPIIPKTWMKSRVMKYIPFFPYESKQAVNINSHIE